MNRTHGLRPWILLGGFSLAALLAACGPDTSAPELPPAAQAARPTATVALEPLTPIIEGTAEPFTDVECLDCHKDQARLKELAVEEETPASLSEGPG